MATPSFYISFKRSCKTCPSNIKRVSASSSILIRNPVVSHPLTAISISLRDLDPKSTTFLTPYFLVVLIISFSGRSYIFLINNLQSIPKSDDIFL